VGRWEPIEPQVWETVITPCECCGQVVPRRLWIADVDGAERRFCSPACEELYRSYLLPRTTMSRGLSRGQTPRHG
jgi:hypothetical protein